MRTVSLVGARPQFVKIAPVCRAMVAFDQDIEDYIVHTGQHYDPALSDVFFDELEIPPPNVSLGVGSASHGVQTALMLERAEELLEEVRPDLLIVYGDTNSTLAGALAAAKLHIPIAHVEAGLRSFNRQMPEEVNRIVSDHISDLLLAPTENAMAILESESLADRSFFVGDVMLDAVRFNIKLARKKSDILATHGLDSKPFGIATLHRPANTDSGILPELLNAISDVADQHFPIVLPVHPRTRSRLRAHYPTWQPGPNLKVIEPVGYLDMLRLLESASLVLTDSGGLQKEAFFLNVPCVTLRDETEWLETVDAGCNILAGSDPTRVREASQELLHRNLSEDFGAARYFGDGHAAEKIISQIATFLSGKR